MCKIILKTLREFSFISVRESFLRWDFTPDPSINDFIFFNSAVGGEGVKSGFHPPGSSYRKLVLIRVKAISTGTVRTVEFYTWVRVTQKLALCIVRALDKSLKGLSHLQAS
jgi:hypothetical protein